MGCNGITDFPALLKVLRDILAVMRKDSERGGNDSHT